MDNILEVRGLSVCFKGGQRETFAVDDVSFDIRRGETLCVVGESGCGKSMTSLSILKLVPTPPGRYAAGEIYYNGENIFKYNKREMADRIRGKEIAMIFQEPMTALNPIHKIGAQITEAIRTHDKAISKQAAWEEAVRALKAVGVPDPARCAASYPHQLSGGMRQRAMIAMALSSKPKLLIADEPTTALDVTIQAQILQIIRRLKEENHMTVLFITHDLGVVAEIADRVVVMYAGKIVEEGSCVDLLKTPMHPYTQGLLKCLPRVDDVRETLDTIEGQIPDGASLPQGCYFHPRCPLCTERCKRERPSLRQVGERKVACHLVGSEEVRA